MVLCLVTITYIKVAKRSKRRPNNSVELRDTLPYIYNQDLTDYLWYFATKRMYIQTFNTLPYITSSIFWVPKFSGHVTFRIVHKPRYLQVTLFLRSIISFHFFPQSFENPFKGKHSSPLHASTAYSFASPLNGRTVDKWTYCSKTFSRP